MVARVMESLILMAAKLPEVSKVFHLCLEDP